MALNRLMLLLLLAASSQAYQYLQERIPNGRTVSHPCKVNYVWQGVGHENPAGGGSKNPFGLAFKAQNLTWTKNLCQADSDGDGKTNGQELGDPNCTWTNGTLPTRTVNITHPGVCDPMNDLRCQGRNDFVDCGLADLKCDSLSDPAVENITIRFPKTAVPNNETTYMCMNFDLPSDADYHIIGSKPAIDNADVMHHLLVYSCDDPKIPAPAITSPQNCGMDLGACRSIIALWTVGAAGICVRNDTGYIFGKSYYSRVKMQVHWNNPQLKSDYTDSSGITLFYTRNLRQYSAATLMVGQLDLTIPGLSASVDQSGTCSADCSRHIFAEPIQVFSAIHHMHYLGKSQTTELYRNGTKVTTMVQDKLYSYDSPINHVFEKPFQVLPGDEIVTTCTFSSLSRNSTTKYGEATSEEMCFVFLGVYPRHALPISTECVAINTYTHCPGMIATTCNLTKDLSPGNTTMMRFFQQLVNSCEPFGRCLPGCKASIDTLHSTSGCFHGEAYNTTKRQLSATLLGMQVLASIESCSPPKECPTCQTCSSGTTGGASSLLPSFATMVIVGMAAVFKVKVF